MSVTHTNRNGKKYYLHEVATRKGNPRYFFSPKNTGNLISEIPPGYEVYEHPNSQVYLRRKVAHAIRSEELQVVEEALRRRNAPSREDSRDGGWMELSRGDTKRLSGNRSWDDEQEVLLELASGFNALRAKIGQAFQSSYMAELRQDTIIVYEVRGSNAQPLFRFTLSDEEERTFSAERYCFLGRIDDWMHIRGEGYLPDLVEKYFPLLGTDEFFEIY